MFVLLELTQNTIRLMLIQYNFKDMNISPIKTEDDYRVALIKMEALFDAPLNTPESDEADILGLLIDEYEKKYYPIEAPDPIEAIKIRMEEMNLKQTDLVSVIGSRSRVSDILNRKRKLTLEMIRNINRQLNLSPKVLINDYELVNVSSAPSPPTLQPPLFPRASSPQA